MQEYYQNINESLEEKHFRLTTELSKGRDRIGEKKQNLRKCIFSFLTSVPFTVFYLIWLGPYIEDFLGPLFGKVLLAIMICSILFSIGSIVYYAVGISKEKEKINKTVEEIAFVESKQREKASENVSDKDVGEVFDGFSES